MPSIYAPSAYAPSLYGPSGALKPGPPPTLIPMGPVYNGYRADYDRASSGTLLQVLFLPSCLGSPV